MRLEEKESFLNKKTKQLQDLTEEKGTLAGEIRDMKDMLEVKERKINVLQKKVNFIWESKVRGQFSWAIKRDWGRYQEECDMSQSKGIWKPVYVKDLSYCTPIYSFWSALLENIQRK